MQNFTFGRKGTNWFLFAFVMLIGTLPSFGQDCPTEDNTAETQTFCYLETVGDISTDGDAIYQTNDNENDTQPIPESELLTDGVTYYAGSTSGDCTRIAIAVTIDSAPRPVNVITNSRTPGFEFTTCASEGFDAADLASLFESEENTSYTIEVYESEFGETPYTGVLTPGSSYFVGQVDNGQTQGCPSLRTAVGFNPNQIEGPIANAAQVFCENATVADLEAQGTYDDTQAIRWYRSEFANSPLASNTELLNGETYYAAQVVNERGSPTPPCETPADDRTAVTVELVPGPDAGEDASGIVCETDVQDTFPSENAVENFYLSLLEDGVPTDGTFSPSISQIVSQYQNDADGLGDFTTTYTIGEDDCSDSVNLTINIIASEEAEAGDDDSFEYCVDQNEDIDLYSFLSGDAVTTGEFSAPYEGGTFNPAVEGEGTFTITYSVNDENSCVTNSDEATFTIDVNEVNEEDISINIDPSEFEGMTEEEIQNDLASRFAPYFDGLPDPNAFEPELEVAFAGLDPQNPEGPYNVSYSGNECEILNFTVIIEEEEEPVPPGDPNGIVCETDVQATFPSNNAIENYYLDLLPAGTATNGTFNPTADEIAEEYQNDEDGLGDFTTTYTVNGESFELTVTIIPTIVANAGEGQTVTYCTGAGEQDLYDLLSEDANEDGVFEGYEDGVFNPSAEGEGTFEITYSVTGETACVTGTASAIFTINVNEGDANAGNDAIGVVCAADVQATFPSINAIENYYLSLLDSGVDRNGSFDPTPSDIAQQYQNDEDGLGDFTTTYTITDGGCEDSVELTVRIVEDAYAGENGSVTLNEDDEPVNLFDYLEGTPDEGGTWSSGNGNFDPATDEPGNYTYTVGTESCEDSAIVTVTVTTDPTDPTEPGCAGGDATGEVCITDVQDTFPSINAIENYYLNLLDSGVDRNGTFDPSPSEIATMYQNDEDGLGDFTTTYTLANEDCEDSTELTVRIIDTEPAEAGDDFSTTFCSNEDDVDLFDFLSEDANPNGYFDDEAFEEGNFSPSELGAGTYNFNYVVDPSNACVEDTDTAAFSIEVFEAPYAGENFAETICITEAEEMISNPQAALDWFNSIVDVEGVDQDGEFDPALLSLAADVYAYVQTPDSPSATFETTYTVSNENCEDFANISLTINNLEEAEAGENVELTFCVSQEDQDLYDYLSEGANPNGYFEDFDGTISPSDLGEGTYTFTYTVDETVDCVTGDESVEFTVNIIGDLNAGADKTASVCNANIENGMFPTSTSVRNYYLNMLDEGVSRNGTFSPSIQDFVDWYNNESEIGDFTTTYTVSEGECSDSAELTVTVYESIPAEIDPIDPVTLCSIDEDQDLFSFLPQGADTNGYFEGYEDGMFSPSTTGAGEFEVTYTLDDSSPCVTGEASADFTITVLETVTAGEDMTADFCATDGEQDLYNFLDAEASVEGEFTYNDEVLVDGMFDASAMGAGSYDVTYTVEPINECGVATSILTVTVNEVPDAPAAPELSAFCAIEMATGADLPTEDNQTWYADADLNTMVTDEDMLEDGSYYLTVTSENGCESEATEVVISVNDSEAPTISSTNLEFCDADDPTIADLTAEIAESGEITWYDSEDGSNALGTSTTLTSGTYYATLTGETGCESSQRLEVTVSVDTCPILYPEAITPNNDQRNDTFIIENITNEYPNYSIEIFNRWGNVIYKGNASTPPWDGTSNQSGSFGDDVLPVGVYFYVIDFNDGSTEPKQGKVYLSR